MQTRNLSISVTSAANRIGKASLRKCPQLLPKIAAVPKRSEETKEKEALVHSCYC